MVTYQVSNIEMEDGGKYYVEGTCLSTDTKPTDVANGSKMIEMDTGKIYMFDADSASWIEFGGE